MIIMMLRFFFFFFNDTATTEIYTLSLHDALPISYAEAFPAEQRLVMVHVGDKADVWPALQRFIDRKSTRLNSSHTVISYAVFCLKKKKQLDSGVWIKQSMPSSPILFWMTLLTISS